ncbi:XRE family transcriptional regulator [Pseudomonas chlororaphis]|uniref:XRE family transcriptional regulator n=1 Tax=Pseudomonas chlororaphis TaxID=587753 RepID=UPI001B306A66|nr:helix-turn-helix transcriptional regulator [Pseudomonas chlororaphis]MBP5054351.1 helix-turn-helix transcriptional regulator [Pseudomonas chlororaphis]MBP5140289.1 helix-turn-helix transcriptional regulator [Pseudomonas chlororaphis]QTT99528.1 helix-turn-helix transcriptional regulator [Pseudomonas chlororaphis]
MKLSDRIKAARQHAELTQRELADRVGIAQTAISQLESGKTLRSSYLLQIAETCGVSAMWLSTGLGRMIISAEQQAFHAEGKKQWEAFEEGLDLANRENGGDLASDVGAVPISVWDDETPLDDDEVEIPFLREVELSAGGGRTVIEQSTTTKLRFGKRSLRARNVQFDQAVCVIVSGNSMEPVLPDGSTVGINTGQRSVVDGKMYALKHDGQLRVKVLYRLPGGGIRMRSLNSAEHPDESYTPEQMAENSIEIIGRVFWGASFFT